MDVEIAGRIVYIQHLSLDVVHRLGVHITKKHKEQISYTLRYVLAKAPFDVRG